MRQLPLARRKNNRMVVTFVSNYINHHQIPFCDAMYEKLSGNFHFVQTQPMEEERVKMGWGQESEKLPYLKLFYEQPEECKKLIAKSDVVLFGGVDDESYIADRLREGKTVVRLSERLYREGQWKAISPRGLKRKFNDHTKYRKKNVYLLCCGGYVASDFHIVRAYPGKMFKWGYMPPTKAYDIEELLDKKVKQREKDGAISLLWAGRFLRLKHPEYAIKAATRLKQEKCKFTLTMVGGGEMETELKEMVKKEELSDVVRFEGFKKPEEVRRYMEEADIFLFTSDYREGWGAVLNESMNSGCAVVTNCAVGAAPFLINHGENGLIYPNNDFENFYSQIKSLVEQEDKIRLLGRKAYETIAKEWNAENAAEKLVTLLHNLQEGKVVFARDGVLSEAPIISPRKMYRYLMKKAK